MKAQVFSDGGEESRRQIAILENVAQRFPVLTIEVLPADGDDAADAGIMIAPGLVIEDLTLAVGQVLSAGRIRRFLQSRGVSEGNE